MCVGIDDAIEDGLTDGDSIGKSIILPSTFAGGQRALSGLYQDAMAIVRHFGKPDIFNTITTNPNWPEIKANLLPGQSPNDRPDLMARAFAVRMV